MTAPRLAPLAIALALAWSPASGQKHGDDVRGRMLDRSQTHEHGTPPSSELPLAHFLTPSGLTDSDVVRMRESVRTIPQKPATLTQSLQDSVGGANFDSGEATLTARARETLDALVAKLKGRARLRIALTGHTDSQRIGQPETLRRFKDNQGLSEARALSVAAYLKERLALPADAIAVEGRGEREPVADDTTAAGMARNRRVDVRAWWEETSVGPTPAPLERRVWESASDCGSGPAARPEVPFRVTVDGVPLEEDKLRPEADRQRCVDVGLARADIQVRYDPMNVSPALNVWSARNGWLRGRPVELHTWANYVHWIRRAEIRVFARGDDLLAAPLATIPVTIGGSVAWQTPADVPAELVYVLRVYDERNRFDETAPKSLTLLEREMGFDDREAIERERLAGHGENARRLSNIPARGGTVTVSGRNVRPGETVSVLGAIVPVDRQGRFAVRQILPPGPHSVEVAIVDGKGEGATFRRNLSIADRDWFYVALADITIGRNATTGPAQLVTGDTRHYDNSVYVDGRGAFYLKGKVKGEYLLTAAADTREQPLRDLFSNFSSKDPRYLLRRIDPERYYPVYGDDGTLADDAPTQGKFYVRLERGDSHVMWGNFQTAWTGTELTQYSRGLYGANFLLREGATGHGEKRTVVNAFAAEPGTIQSREEFRATGGSLYYLRRQDITLGSERVWVEIRDRDSGLVIRRTPLRPVEDYEVSYLQGRILLRSPLASTADGSQLVQTGSLSGHPVYLVVNYEFAPGLTALDALAYGLRAHHWFGDHLGLGLSGYRQGSDGNDQKLRGADLTLRYKPGTWLKAELARSDGTGTGALSSLDGGFGFNALTSNGQGAQARRLEGTLDLADVAPGVRGRVGGYLQNRDAGFSGPGQITANGEGTRQRGLAAAVAVTRSTTLELKADERESASQDVRAVEGAVRHQLTPDWRVGVGLRHDDRDTRVASLSPTLSQTGERTDVVLRVDYRRRLSAEETAKIDAEAARRLGETPATAPPAPPPGTQVVSPTVLPSPLVSTPPVSGAAGRLPGGAIVADVREPGARYAPWELYGFVQGTASRSGNRTDNDRIGAGTAWQATDRLKLLGELSAGDGGPGGRIGGDWRIDDRSSAYLTYSVENERPDAALRGRFSNLVSGSRHRLSDRASTFGETRWSTGAGPESLTHAFGLDYAPVDRWTTGLKFETGKLSDPLAGDIDRRALGLSAAYREEGTRLASALEYRDEQGNVAGTRRTWLMRNNLGHQATPAWRLLGKLNFSFSESSRGAFFDGDFVELVTGAAYRPVDNNRWNTLFKYTYFHTLPSPGQVSPSNVALDFAQKSHVLNFDTIYDVKPWLSVGFKYGLRLGELKDTKVAGNWFGSRADLVIGRLDFHWVKEWDAIVELRRLAVREANDARSGALVAVYRHVGEGVKVGVGYNFTNFSDNLTDLTYRSRGWFVNVLSTF